MKNAAIGQVLRPDAAGRQPSEGETKMTQTVTQTRTDDINRQGAAGERIVTLRESGVAAFLDGIALIREV